MATEVKVVRGEGKLQHKVEIGAHTLVADAPKEFGGDAAGPAPHDLLSAALAACTGVTLTMYAARKTMDLQDLDIRVTQSTVDGGTVFNRSIKFIGNLSAEDKQRLTEIADKCPVHKILSGSINIVTEAA